MDTSPKRERSRSPRGKQAEKSDITETVVKQDITSNVITSTALEDEEKSSDRSSDSPRKQMGILKLPTYTDVDPSTWVFKHIQPTGSKNDKQPIVMINDDQDRKPHFCFYTKNDLWGEIVYPLQPYGEQMPSFMSGGPSKTAVERLNLNITLEGKQYSFASQVDEITKKAIFQNSKEWFGKQASEQEIEICYTSSIKIDEEGKYKPTLRTKIALAGIDKYLTEVTFVDMNKSWQRGSGWEFVEPKLGETKWKGYKARCVLQPRLWISAKNKYGLNYEITELAVIQQETEKGSQFDKDDTLAAAFSDNL